MLDGKKRWIGNGTWAEVTVVWARNSESGQVRRVRITWRNPRRERCRHARISVAAPRVEP